GDGVRVLAVGEVALVLELVAVESLPGAVELEPVDGEPLCDRRGAACRDQGQAMPGHRVGAVRRGPSVAAQWWAYDREVARDVDDRRFEGVRAHAVAGPPPLRE